MAGQGGGREQHTRDEETRRVREEEERRQRAESEREARQREDRLRLEEAERRARVDGELETRHRQLLEKQRQRDLQGRPFGRSAWMAAAVGAALFLAIGAGLAAWASQQHHAEEEAYLEGRIAQRSASRRGRHSPALDARIRALEEIAHRYLGEAKTANDQARILGDLQRQKQAIEATRPRPPRRTLPPIQPTVATSKPPFRVPKKPEINDEPLGGLPDIKKGGF